MKKTQRNFRLEPNLLARLERQAEREMRTATNMLEFILNRSLPEMDSEGQSEVTKVTNEGLQ